MAIIDVQVDLETNDELLRRYSNSIAGETVEGIARGFRRSGRAVTSFGRRTRDVLANALGGISLRPLQRETERAVGEGGAMGLRGLPERARGAFRRIRQQFEEATEQGMSAGADTFWRRAGRSAQRARSLRDASAFGLASAGFGAAREFATFAARGLGAGAAAGTIGTGVGVGLAAAAAPTAIGIVGRQSALAAEDLERNLSALQLALTGTGRTAQAVTDEIQEGTNNILTAGESARIGFELVEAGITRNLGGIAAAFADIAAFERVDVSNITERARRGILTGRSQALLTVGINVDFDRAYADAAARLGVTTDELTEKQLQQARALDVQRAAQERATATGNQATGANAEVVQSMRQAATAADDLSVAFGQLITPLTISAFRDLTSVINFAADAVRFFGRRLSDDFALAEIRDEAARLDTGDRASVAALVTRLESLIPTRGEGVDPVRAWLRDVFEAAGPAGAVGLGVLGTEQRLEGVAATTFFESPEVQRELRRLGLEDIITSWARLIDLGEAIAARERRTADEEADTARKRKATADAETARRRERDIRIDAFVRPDIPFEPQFDADMPLNLDAVFETAVSAPMLAVARRWGQVAELVERVSQNAILATERNLDDIRNRLLVEIQQPGVEVTAQQQELFGRLDTTRQETLLSDLVAVTGRSEEELRRILTATEMIAENTTGVTPFSLADVVGPETDLDQLRAARERGILPQFRAQLEEERQRDLALGVFRGVERGVLEGAPIGAEAREGFQQLSPIRQESLLSQLVDRFGQTEEIWRELLQVTQDGNEIWRDVADSILGGAEGFVQDVAVRGQGVREAGANQLRSLGSQLISEGFDKVRDALGIEGDVEQRQLRVLEQIRDALRGEGGGGGATAGALLGAIAGGGGGGGVVIQNLNYNFTQPGARGALFG